MKFLYKIFSVFGTNKNEAKEKFTKIYKENIFEGDDSISGKGSNLLQTATIREEIPRLLKKLNVITFMDAPCGDFFWMKETKLGVEKYIGIDIVAELIEKNKVSYANHARQFLCLDIIEDKLPQADMIHCRDCLVHLTFEQAKKVLLNFKKSGSTYLLTTTFISREKNVDLKGNDIWRTLNLEKAPFNFTKPLLVINENCTEADNQFTDKCLGLWKLDNIKI